jgi:hypothetical protein
MPFDAADLAAFLDPDMPGYALATVGGAPVGGLFRSPYAESFGLVGTGSPAFRALSSDLAAVAPGDSIDIRDTAYRVAAVRPDGAGMTVLDLK